MTPKRPPTWPTGWWFWNRARGGSSRWWTSSWRIRAYRFDGWELNLNTRRLAAADGKQVPLSNGEFALLVVLLGSPQRILMRDQLLDLSRLHNDEVYNRSVDVQIMRLRRKIEPDPAQPRYIRTERGAGYLFGVPVETVY